MSWVFHPFWPTNISLAFLITLSDFLLVLYDHLEIIIYWGLKLLENFIGVLYLKYQYRKGTVFPKGLLKNVFHVQNYTEHISNKNTKFHKPII